MRRSGVVGALAVVLAVVALTSSCSDSTRPSTPGPAIATAANSFAPPASASPADTEQARALARTLAEGLEQGAPTRVTPREVDCLVDQVVAHLDVAVLSDIASNQPPPSALPEPVRRAFVDAFDRCLPPEVAGDLRTRFGQ